MEKVGCYRLASLEAASGSPQFHGGIEALWLIGSLLLPSRVSDSDDLIMTENEVGKVALHIEKEMFNLFHVTDNRYKSKYRSIMFNLKDPKNQVCAGASGLFLWVGSCHPRRPLLPVSWLWLPLRRVRNELLICTWEATLCSVGFLR